MNIYKHLIFSIVWFSIFLLVFLYTKGLNGTANTIAHISSGILSFVYMLITLNSFFIIWRYLKLKKSNPQVFDNIKKYKVAWGVLVLVILGYFFITSHIKNEKELWSSYIKRSKVKNTYQFIFGKDKCTLDCRGHNAGYGWSFQRDKMAMYGCKGHSESFDEGCNAGIEIQKFKNNLKKAK